MTLPLQIAETRLLLPAGLDADGLERSFGTLLGPGIDFGDLYFQHSRRESWTVEDGIVKDGSHSIEQGVGVRAISGEKTGFAYSDEINSDALLGAAKSARAIARDGRSQNARSLVRGGGRSLYPSDDPIDSIGNESKVEALRKLDKLLRAADPRVQQVVVSLSGTMDTVLVARSDGVLAADVRPLVRLNVQVIVEHNGRRESGYSGGGGRYSYADLLGGDKPEQFAREALRQALVNLDAVDAPAGIMPVVLGSGWPGVLLHEAVGHGLEGDFNRKGTSTYAGRMGQRVASPGVTIVDDGTLEGRRGSLNVDDEGTPTNCTTLIEDGVLVGYMQDTLNARLMGMTPTGNGRRESFAHLPMPRMTNTYMLAGKDDPEDMIRSVKKGLYAVNFGGGQVDITSGKYVFSATEAYLIEDGKITAPVKGATLIGNGPETMQKVRMIGHDLALDEGVGVCGKDGQSVPVGVGQPSLLIDGLTVGGTSA
ncbi:metalloprotease TldD [Lysobacter capsici]|jgi:TldD protein|uniref:TldD protein, part of TldE/TldD proteolytic complex n=1 Tax=Lysobacter capsici AZ78 TaxID=1444315 RepID=A0A108U701_9GAMM|nr:metalloprotease TldD [Lysobacter capsici]ALN85114.1 modulator of DNA gyrase family protein [Lysobacter capsici]KWS03709.1 TldD protein, part of TldE/TldD proteolytic complex [Lysobacter capsici AZ78]UOF16630.1 metalloprotease TldD [Lysobacter capsici]WND82313.1 metalloprotease TldD [Lysobacter capsici]WND87509.1 metalloprotease TldD [Lysobacter capsici]